jgi:endonuclease/exonuclease/phosphatase family metal-dependent hydrolase
MSPLNRFVKMAGIAAALDQVQSDIICLQEVQGQNLKRVVKYNEFPDQSQHEWFGEYLQLENSYGKNVEYGIHTEPAGNGQRKGGVTCRGSST